MQPPTPPGQPNLMCAPVLLLYPKCVGCEEPSFA